MSHEKEGFIRSNGSNSYDLVWCVKTRVKVGSAHSEEFEVDIGVQQRFVLRHYCLQ